MFFVMMDTAILAIVGLGLTFVFSAGIFGALLVYTDKRTAAAIAFSIAIVALIGALVLTGSAGHSARGFLFWRQV